MFADDAAVCQSGLEQQVLHPHTYDSTKLHLANISLSKCVFSSYLDFTHFQSPCCCHDDWNNLASLQFHTSICHIFFHDKL